MTLLLVKKLNDNLAEQVINVEYGGFVWRESFVAAMVEGHGVRQQRSYEYIC